MERNHFLASLEWINRDLNQRQVNRACKSLGWNIFFEFGKNVDILCPNGKTRQQKEWKIWIAHASWRIMKDQKYYLGSMTPSALKKSNNYFINQSLIETSEKREENSEINLQESMQILLGKQFQSVNMVSSYLDAEFHFEGGYTITTFFNMPDKIQWAVYLPDRTVVSVDCSTKESINDMQNLSKNLEIKAKYKKTDIACSTNIKSIVFQGDGSFSIVASDNLVLETGESAWRISKKGDYIIGQLDYFYEYKEKEERKYREMVSQLVGKRMKSVETDGSGMDMRLQLDDETILELFTTASSKQWRLSQEGVALLSAKI